MMCIYFTFTWCIVVKLATFYFLMTITIISLMQIHITVQNKAKANVLASLNCLNLDINLLDFVNRSHFWQVITKAQCQFVISVIQS